MKRDNTAWLIQLNGIVQGVGFRPFSYKLAREMKINGWVSNSTNGLKIHAEGYEVGKFFQRLINEAPLMSKITFSHWQETEFKGYPSFQIVTSEENSNRNVLISPDIATCKECVADIFEKSNHRFQYPLANCTNCGPRYTIVQDIPYDRQRTTMKDFSMCNYCFNEYKDPSNRRFHAQPIACQDCGPHVELIDTKGHPLEGVGIKQLIDGSILAIKGIGGFHLVCDARNKKTVKRLRQLKERGSKPFAVMARNIETALAATEISNIEKDLLESSAAPIVVLKRRENSFQRLPAEIAPGLQTIGLMLPYTPLHHLLFQGPYDFLVMTSANLNGRPLIYNNAEAFNELQGIADYFLFHNREIFHPCDDSVVQVINNIPMFFRRARGYVPLPIESSSPMRQPIFAVGAEMKNAFALASGDKIFLSQHIGDIEGYENYLRFQQEIESFQRVVNISPEVVVHDCHPDYQTTRFAQESSWTKIPAQHHHAHLVSVLGEHKRKEVTMGIICDGTGLGDDGRIWGFEYLLGNAAGYRRIAHLDYLPLPGGDSGMRYPLRIAYAYLNYLFTENEWRKIIPLWKNITDEEQRLLNKQIASGFQVYFTSSAGRLFDAVSGLLGICLKVTYEGQAAVELENEAAKWISKIGRGKGEGIAIYSVEFTKEENSYVLKLHSMFKELAEDILQGKEAGEIAFSFHLSLARAMVDLAERLGVEKGPLVINGGVFQNKLLTEEVIRLCQKKSICVLRPKHLPPGDGGLALGQILIANEVLGKCV